MARDPKEKPQLSLKTQALKILVRREHTRAELRGKLLSVNEDTEAVDGLLDTKREALEAAARLELLTGWPQPFVTAGGSKP